VRIVLLYWLPTVAYCAAIYALSSLPASKLALELFPHADKLIHAVEYGLLGVLVARALGKGTPWELRRIEAVVGAILFCLAFGALDEIHQSYVPGRLSEVLDVVADVGGGALAAALYAWLALVPSDSQRAATR
jgi:VanZ family protein